MSMVVKRLIELLEQQADPRTKKFAFVNGSPFKFYAFICVFLLIIKSLFLFKNNFDLRPIKLILNGFIFGCYLVGLLFGIWLCDGARVFKDCSPLNPDTTDLKQWFTVYVSYMFLLMKVFEIGINSLTTFNEKSNSLPPPLVMAKGLLETAFLFIVVKLYPGGIMFFFGVFEGLASCIEYAHQTLVLASSEMRPDPKWRKMITVVRYLQYILTAAHGLYFIMQPSCVAPRESLILQVVYCVLNLVLVKLNAAREDINA